MRAPGKRARELLLMVSDILNDNLYFRSDFEQEARILTSLDDVNLVSIIGVCFEGEPYSMICEYTEIGDLNQFLQDHIAETSLSKSPGVPTLRYVVEHRILFSASVGRRH